MKRALRSLVEAWLLLDFFGRGRREHRDGSSLTTTIFAQSFLSLAVAALLFGPDAKLVPFMAANLSLSTLLVGLGALAETGRADRAQADRVLVGTAPQPRVMLPLARVLHGGFHLGLITIGTALAPAILAGFLRGAGWWVVPGYLIAAVLLAGMLAGGIGMLLRLIAEWRGLRVAALVAGTTRALALALGTVAFALCLPELDGTAADLPGGAAAALAWPPYWAARALEAPIAGWAFGAALFGLAVTMLVVSLWRGERAIAERGGARRSSAGPLVKLEHRLAGGGPLLAATRFTATMMRRSPAFRARVLPLMGVPAALVWLASGTAAGHEQQLLLGVTLQFPAIYLPFLVLFLPYVDQPAAAWLFAASPRYDLELAREGALIALSLRLLMPLQLLAIAVGLLLGFPPLVALDLPLFSFGLSVWVAAFEVRRLEEAPFTVGEGEGPAPDLGGVIVPAMLLAILGGGFALVAGSAWSLPLALALAGSACWRLARGRRRWAA